MSLDPVLIIGLPFAFYFAYGILKAFFEANKELQELKAKGETT